MKISRNGVALAAIVALIVAGGAAIGQDVPESILPPGFNDPTPPAPTPTPGSAPVSAPNAPAQPSGPQVAGVPTPTPTPTATETPVPVDLAAYELPDFAKRSLAEVGPDAAGLTGAAFGAAGGRSTEMLMRRLDAPLPSRWLSIALRRALVSRVATPGDVNGADFAAERAWLLLRMGEANAARAVVQSVDVDNYTPKLFQIAMQAMLANGDPAGLCPLVEPASRVSGEQGWVFARAMCSALGGKPVEAGVEFDNARRRTGRTIDALLAEKVVGAGAQGRRAVTIEWAGVDRLTAWRFGLSTATGVEIPDELMAATRPQVALWRATAPMLEPSVRIGLADEAAVRGVLSSAALIDLYSEIEASDDSGTNAGALARDLRSAYSAGSSADRVATLRRIWGDDAERKAAYARIVLTAHAAATVAPAAAQADDAPRLIAAMLSAGMDRHADRWRRFVPAASDGWAMLALATPDRIATAYGDVDGYRAGDASPNRIKTRMLLAALTGLGRLPLEEAQQLAQPLDVKFGAESSWTRAIRTAAERREAGKVVLLYAIGMQTADWRGVPAEVVYHGTAAMRAVGLEGEARMIAAEAVARL